MPETNDNFDRNVKMTRRTLRLVAALVAEAYDLEIEHLFGSTRGMAHVATARQVFIYLLNTEFGMTAKQVAFIAGRDRTTVQHAVSKIEDLRDDADFERRMTCLTERVRGAFNDLEPRAIMESAEDRIARMYPEQAPQVVNGTGSLIFLDGENLGLRALSRHDALTAVLGNLENRGVEVDASGLANSYAWRDGRHHFTRPARRQAPSAPRKIA